jgi:kumamolisin
VFTAKQVAAMYGFPASTGAGQTIGIIQLGGGYRPSELTTYFGNPRIALPVPTVVPVSVAGGVNNPADVASSTEVLLDTLIAGTVAPGATQRVYFAPNSFASFYSAVAAAVRDRVSVISISWGAPEKHWPRSTLVAMAALLDTAAAAGISVFVASGDNGSGNGLPGVNADFPCAAPGAIACGGTRLLSADGATIQAETVWNASGGATGGGYSAVLPAAAHQVPVLPPAARGFRGVPDVTGNADPATGYLIYVGGRWMVVGGTSAVAPLYAGLQARLRALGAPLGRAGWWGPALYADPAKYVVDVTVGNNGAYTATRGWDPASGLGRLWGPALLG